MMLTTTILTKQCICMGVCVCVYLYMAYFRTLSVSHRLHSGKW